MKLRKRKMCKSLKRQNRRTGKSAFKLYVYDRNKNYREQNDVEYEKKTRQAQENIG